MESSPIRDPRILEALEACRPGSEDIRDPVMEPLARQLGVFPELAALYERLQQTDRAIAEAFRDVPVPAGLAARVLTQMAAAPALLEELLSMPPPGASPGIAGNGRGGTESLAPPVAPVPSPALREGTRPMRADRRGWPRRGWLFASGALVVAASVLVAVFLNAPKPDRVSTEEVLNKAIAFFDNDARESGLPLGFGHVPPAGYPLSPALPTRTCQVRWRWVDGFLDLRGVAYDFKAPGGISATVYVVKRPLLGLGSSPPAVPMLATGRRATAVWQEGDLVYVLVVEGESREYERFFQELATGPVT